MESSGVSSERQGQGFQLLQTREEAVRVPGPYTHGLFWGAGVSESTRALRPTLDLPAGLPSAVT